MNKEERSEKGLVRRTGYKGNLALEDIVLEDGGGRNDDVVGHVVKLCKEEWGGVERKRREMSVWFVKWKTEKRIAT